MNTRAQRHCRGCGQTTCPSLFGNRWDCPKRAHVRPKHCQLCYGLSHQVRGKVGDKCKCGLVKTA